MAPFVCKSIAGIKYGERTAKNWAELIKIYDECFSTDKLQARNERWLFRANEIADKDKPDNQVCLTCTVPSQQWNNCKVSQRTDRAFCTHLEEAFRGFEIHADDDRRKWEKHMIHDFKRKLHHYTPHVPEDEDVIEWLALMRHYGAPTRLLDFTYSFFVACYFAVNRLDHEKKAAEIWAIEGMWLSNVDYTEVEPKDERISTSIGPGDYLRFKTKAERRAERLHVDKQTTKANQIVHFLMKTPKACVYNVTPFRLNDRLLNQRGTFLLQGDINKCFFLNLQETISIKDPDKSLDRIKRIVIKLDSVDDKKRILSELDQRLINQAVLFPDLVGFAESLRTCPASAHKRIPTE